MKYLVIMLPIAFALSGCSSPSPSVSQPPLRPPTKWTTERALAEADYATRLKDAGMPDLAMHVLNHIPDPREFADYKPCVPIRRISPWENALAHPLEHIDQVDSLIFGMAITNELTVWQMKRDFADALFFAGETNLSVEMYQDILREVETQMHNKASEDTSQ